MTLEYKISIYNQLLQKLFLKVFATLIIINHQILTVHCYFQVETKIITKANEAFRKHLKDKKFPKDLSPVDFMIAKIRNEYKDKIKTTNKTIDLSSVLSLQVSQFIKYIQVKPLIGTEYIHSYCSNQPVCSNLVN